MEAFILTFSPIALTDIEQAIGCDEDLQEGLGEKFSAACKSPSTPSGATHCLRLYGTMTSDAPKSKNPGTLCINMWTMSEPLPLWPFIRVTRSHYGNLKNPKNAAV
jgi:hypothetical protein